MYKKILSWKKGMEQETDRLWEYSQKEVIFHAANIWDSQQTMTCLRKQAASEIIEQLRTQSRSQYALRFTKLTAGMNIA